MPDLDLPRGGVDPRQPARELGELLGLHEIGLGDQEPIGHRSLLRGLRLPVQLGDAVDGVDRRDEPVDAVLRLHHRIREQRREDRRGIRQPGRLDRDALVAGDLAARAAGLEVAQLVGEVGADRAADAARGHHDGALVDAREQVVVERDLAELVDQHRRLTERGIGQQLPQQRGLAAPEEARDQRDRGLASRCAQRSSRSASSGSIGAPGETLGLGEERGEIGAQHGLARARAQHVGRALPLRDRQRERPQDAVQQLDAPQAIAHPGPPRVGLRARAGRLGPVARRVERSAERAHEGIVACGATR